MSVKEAVIAFANGQIRNRIFITPDIPSKKLQNARSKFITSSDEVIVLVDDTLFGSSKDGLAITENYIYAKQSMDAAKSMKIASVKSVTIQSNKLNSLDVYLNGNLFVTLSTIDKLDHKFVGDVIKVAQKASQASIKPKATKKEKKSPETSSKAATKSKGSQAVKVDHDLSCSHCNTALPAGAKFCLECGEKVKPKGLCEGCGLKLPKGAKFCPDCGHPVSGASSVSTGASIQPVTVDEPVAVLESAMAQLGDAIEPLSADNPDFYEVLDSIEIDPAENARSLIKGNPKSSDLLSATKTFLDRIIERCGHHEDFMRDACASIADPEGPYQSILGKAYEYNTGESYDPDDEYINVSFDDLAGYITFSEEVTSDVSRYDLMHRMLEAIVQTVEHAGEWGFAPEIDDVPNLEPQSYLSALESKIVETIERLSAG